MNSKIIYFFTALALSFLQNSGWAQSDSIPIRLWGLGSGYYKYASIDEIFSPYIYSGSAANYELKRTVISMNNIREYTASYASIMRKPLYLKLYSTFNMNGYDGGSYSIQPYEEFPKMSTQFITSEFSFLWKSYILNSKKHKFYYGLTNNIALIYKSTIVNPELISLTLNPALLYNYDINKRFMFSIKTSISLAGISMRRPYADAEAQLTDNYSFKLYLEYIANHIQFDFLNAYIRTNTAISFRIKLNNRYYIYSTYQFQYLKLNKPRKLSSTSDIFNLGLYVKLK